MGNSDFTAIAVLLRNFENLIRQSTPYRYFKFSNTCYITRTGRVYVGVYDESNPISCALVSISDEEVPNIVLDKGIGLLAKEIFDSYWDLTSFSESKYYSSVGTNPSINAWIYDLNTFKELSEHTTIYSNNSKIFQELGG